VVTYFKQNGSPGLLAKNIANKNDPRLRRMTAARSLARESSGGLFSSVSAGPWIEASVLTDRGL
jgi:hypothetical protein